MFVDVADAPVRRRPLPGWKHQFGIQPDERENKNVKVPMVIEFFQNVNNTFWGILEYFMKLHFKKA